MNKQEKEKLGTLAESMLDKLGIIAAHLFPDEAPSEPCIVAISGHKLDMPCGHHAYTIELTISDQPHRSIAHVAYLHRVIEQEALANVLAALEATDKADGAPDPCKDASKETP